MDWSKLEKKWQERWSKDRDFETKPDSREKKFITVAYPYPNSPQHVGHGRTYTTADVHARFLRMKGYNVLFPMAFHYTGTPILGMAKRVQAQDIDIINVLKGLYGVPKDIIEGFVEPIKIADYFSAEIKQGMNEMGYSIDWRGEFTTIDAPYKKFIEWQANTLKKKGLIVQGSHPVGWCPKDGNPVSQHDTMGDVEPDFTEYSIIKFECDGYILPAATLRAETIFGVTNLWVNPEILYEKVTIDGKRWIVSPECTEKLAYLGKKIERGGDILGSNICKMVATNYKGREIPIFPAHFVKTDVGTGIVMSVPAHAPFDYCALTDLAARKDSFATKAAAIKPIVIIKSPEYNGIPAQEQVKKDGIKDQNDPRLEESTKIVYAKEFYGGVMMENTGKFVNTKTSDAKDIVHKWLVEKDIADKMFEMTNHPVRCRCGAVCVIKMLENQWFLNYGDESWKKKAAKCFSSMQILPAEIKTEFDHTLKWLHQRAYARQSGLGTPLPWDKDWIIESLADSVIYMSYYTISRLVNAGKIKPKDITAEFCDYVFLGKGSLDRLCDGAREARESFEYYYPVDSRHSGRDLVPNHLSFFVLNHVAIYNEERWPRQIVVNGSVLMDGKKMSKSMGNIIPLRQAIQKYGADPIRAAILVSSELLQDADFNIGSVDSISRRLESLITNYNLKSDGPCEELEDVWLLSRLNKAISDTTKLIKKMRLREALHIILYGLDSDIQWHAKRMAARNRTGRPAILGKIDSARALMLSPFTPHTAEEMWERLGNTTRASKSSWPIADESISNDANITEDLLKRILEDISKILKVTKMSPKIITIYTAGDLKTISYRRIVQEIQDGASNMGQIMPKLLLDSNTQNIKKSPDYVQRSIKDILSETEEVRRYVAEKGVLDEKKILSDTLPDLIKMQFGAHLRIFSEDDAYKDDSKGKAKYARPLKPAILVE
ncbi:MAG: leucine--tRNA ligase [Cenarchaeum symbiont of Oopsacas minuta]|nr:leucine--tRNA ligase [Cenarchaeum symbiont of Oopsacas minuta]